MERDFFLQEQNEKFHFFVIFIMVMSLPLEDVRYNLLYVLDHYLRDLVYSLWLLESVDVRINQFYNSSKSNSSNVYRNENLENIEYL